MISWGFHHHFCRGIFGILAIKHMGIELGPLEKSTSPAMKKIWLVILEKKVMGVTQCHNPPISEWFIHVYTTYLIMVKLGILYYCFTTIM